MLANKESLDSKTKAKMRSIDDAVEIYNEIVEASNCPEKSITGKSLECYKYLKRWGITEMFNINEPIHKRLYITLLSMILYEDNISEKGFSSLTEEDNINGSKFSKWTLITEKIKSINLSNDK